VGQTQMAVTAIVIKGSQRKTDKTIGRSSGRNFNDSERWALAPQGRNSKTGNAPRGCCSHSQRRYARAPCHWDVSRNWHSSALADAANTSPLV